MKNPSRSLLFIAVLVSAAIAATACGGAATSTPEQGATDETVSGTSSSSPSSPQQGKFEAIAPMKEGRQSHAMVLLHDGTIMAIAGQGLGNTATYNANLNSAEVYDPTTNEWTLTGTLNAFRVNPAAITLSDGRVLVAGGGTVDRNATALAETWDPATGQWTEIAPMNQAREKMPMVQLNDGRILVVGGSDETAQRTVTVEIYDLTTDTWTDVPPMGDKRIWHTATLLTGGKVLVTGGGNPDGPFLSSAEVFDPATETWSSAGQMNVSRSQHTATLLTDGRVLVVGGRGKRQTSEIYDPVTNTWGTFADTNIPRAEHVALELPDGNVIVAGGTGNRDSIEVYDPISATWTLVGTMKLSRYRFTGTLLGDGRVALVGGQGKESTLADSEAFTPVLSNRTEAELLAAAEQARAQIAAALASATSTPVPSATPEPDREATTGEGLDLVFAAALESDESGRTTVPLNQPVRLALDQAVISPDPNTGATATFTEVVEDSRAGGGKATITVSIRMGFFEQGTTDLTLDPTDPDSAVKKLGRLWVGLVALEENAAGAPVASVVIFLP
jgi:hypothetical protein